MSGERITVGFNGSVGSRQALTWAVREAARRRGRVLVVRAWETGGRPATEKTAATLRLERIALDEQMRQAIEVARHDLAEHPLPGREGAPPPPIARELIIADPVTALCHAARTADLVAIGTGPVIPAILARRLARRRRRFGGPCPLMVVVPVEPDVAPELVRLPELVAAA